MIIQSTAIPLSRALLAIGLLVASLSLLIACESPSAQVEQATPEPVGYMESDGVRRVTPEQAKMLLDQDKAVLVDTRSSASFMRARAAGAILAYAGDIYQERLGELADVPEHKQLVFY